MSKPLGIIVPQQSRFDKANNKLMCGPAGEFVADCLKPYNLTLDDCEVCLPGHLPSTTYTVATGTLGRSVLDGSPLDTVRGYRRGSLIETYWPQDCVDMQDYENPDLDVDEFDDSGSNKDTAITSRQNFRFWFQQDLAKLLNKPHFLYNNFPPNLFHESYHLPAPGEKLYFDIETHPKTNTLQCFSYAIDNEPVYSCTVYDYRGMLNPVAVKVLARLATIAKKATTIIHNCFFDNLFLAHFHGLPFGRSQHDTMLMHHRMFPEVEKSLAHVISLYTNLPYHKDEAGTFYPHNYNQQLTLLRYNSKDVFALREVYRGMFRHPQYKASKPAIEQVQKLTYPMLVTSLKGMNVDSALLSKKISEIKAKVAFYKRILSILVGQDFNPASSQQCAQYFHTAKKYEVVERTSTGEPSMAGDVLYKLLTLHKNPVITVILAIRALEKQQGQLEFTPLIRYNSRV